MNEPDDLSPEDAELARRLRASRTLEAPPPHVLQRAFDVWRPRAQPAPGLLRRLVAALRFDSAAAPPLALGVRSASAAAAARQLLFSAEGHDVDLRLQPRPDGGTELRGQVLGPALCGHAELRRDDDAAWSARASLDELGEFVFDALPAGRYRLTLALGDVQIELPPWQLGDDPGG